MGIAIQVLSEGELSGVSALSSEDKVQIKAGIDSVLRARASLSLSLSGKWNQRVEVRGSVAWF